MGVRGSTGRRGRRASGNHYTASIALLGRDNNHRGDVFTQRMGDVLHALGWGALIFDVAKSGREIDISAKHRTEAKVLRAECKAESRPVGGSALNKFAGAVQAEQAASSLPVMPYFISLSGFTGPAIVQEEEARRQTSLMAAKEIIDELQAAQIIVSADAARERVRRSEYLLERAVPTDCVLLAHEAGWIWLVYSAVDHERRFYSLVHADGDAIAGKLHDQIRAAGPRMDELTAELEYVPLEVESESDFQRVEHEYLSFLSREFGFITLEGMPADEEVGGKRIAIADMYVPLEVFSETNLGNATEVSGSPFEGEPRQTLAPFLLAHKHVALVAPPGGGKSTIIKWLVAETVSGGAPTSEEESWMSGVLPVVLRCRSLPEGAASILEVIERSLQQAELPELASGFSRLVRQRLRSGNLLLLVDGLDEIADASERARMAGRLRALLGTYPQIRLVVTSRPSAFLSVAPALREICAVARVADLSNEGYSRSLSELAVASSWRSIRVRRFSG